MILVRRRDVACVSKVYVAAIAILLSVAHLPAQDSIPAKNQTPEVVPRMLCWRGRPLPHCEQFIQTDLHFHRRIIRPTVTVAGILPDGRTVNYGLRVAKNVMAFELGTLNNVSKHAAIGASLSLGGDDADVTDGPSVGARLRYKYWLGPKGNALDVGAGVEVRPVRQALAPNIRKGGFTADVALNANDHIAAFARYDQMQIHNTSRPAVSLGVKTGAQFGFFTALSIAVTGCTLALIFAGLGEDY